MIINVSDLDLEALKRPRHQKNIFKKFANLC